MRKFFIYLNITWKGIFEHKQIQVIYVLVKLFLHLVTYAWSDSS
jgi:hypothetical protein